MQSAKERNNLVLDLGSHAHETITDMQRAFVQVRHIHDNTYPVVTSCSAASRERCTRKTTRKINRSEIAVSRLA